MKEYVQVSEEYIKSIELNKTFQLILRSDVTEDKLSLSWVVNVKLFLCFFTSGFVYVQEDNLIERRHDIQ